MKLKKSLVLNALWTLIIGAGFSFMVLSGFYLYLSPQLPPVDSIKDYRLQTPLRIYSADHKLIGEIGEKRRIPISFAEIPQSFHNALIAAEDADFYSHNGVSLKGLFRAAGQLILTGRKESGGSTLTMQLTRHIFLSLKQTFSRKFNEILLAIRIEKTLSKEEIFELYCNYMFLGKRAYGIQAAAEVYYGKPIDQLSLAQHAMIVGIFKGPSTLNPIANPQRAKERRNYILGRMLKLNYINEAEYEAAVVEPVVAEYHGNKIDVDAPYVAEMARQLAVDLYGNDAYTDGYSVYTTVDSKLQTKAQEAVINGLLVYDWRHGYRGPEMNIAGDQSKSNDSQTEVGTGEINQKKWLDTLKTLPTYGGLHPAAVTHIDEEKVTALLEDGQLIDVLWDNGLSSASRYINENAVGKSPETPADVVNIGDIIRVRPEAGKDETVWHLSQIPEAQSSLVALSPKNGAIISLVGGFDFNSSNFNRPVQAARQPGSNFKPFIYTAALENGLTAATIINDAPIVFDDSKLESAWRPENSSDKFYGPTRLREALYRSINLVSIRVLERVGISNAITTLEKFGFKEEDLPRDLTLALGSHAITQLDVAKGYAAFANGGYRVEPYVVESIFNYEGDKVYQAAPLTVCKACDEEDARQKAIEESERLDEEALADSESQVPEPLLFDTDYNFIGDAFAVDLQTKQILGIAKPEDLPRAPRVMSEDVAFIIDSMMKDVIRRGTGIKAKQALNRSDIAGKTGTTNGPIDSWFSGYHPNLVTSTWLGFDQNKLLGRREFGGTAALPIWIDYMKLALANEPIVNRIQPSNVVSVRINPDTGKRAKIGDPDAIFEIFRTENLPEMDENPEVDPYSEEVITDDLF
ncbi:Penicillin-binding protein 1A [Thalassocella blandensis]|nr:Penicillin-binding protein 1A [Thalassocella blandensis]